ncbi:MAG: TetR/AcrR family transcriptional regulator [Lysobacterales bacterium]|nr:MAG: TetR/AcrR family transcriptional regulator [Xanthomonadales bacterium]
MTQATPLSEGAQRILRIAAPLFAVKGFSGVSINDIAEAVGGSKANIFHHFPNKQALYLAAIGSACEAFRSAYGKAEDGSDGDRVRAIAGRHLARMFADPDSVRLILREVFAGDKGQDRARVAGILHQNFALLVGEVEEEQSRGRVRADVDPAMVALTVLALNNFFFQSWSILERFEEFRPFASAQECAAAAFDTLAEGWLQR